MDEKYKQINKHIIHLKKLIEKIKSYQEFLINDYIIFVFKKYGFRDISVYSFDELNINYVRIDISSINKFDLILCYYYFCNMFNTIGVLKTKLPSYSDIDIIMRQTTYSREEAETYFEKFGSVEKCIHYYLGIKPKEEPNISTNQKIFKTIRDFF